MPTRIPRWQLILYSSGSLATAVSYQAAVFGFRLMLAGIPALALVLGYYLLGKYSLHGEKLVEMRTAVSQLHVQKRDQLQT